MACPHEGTNDLSISTARYCNIESKLNGVWGGQAGLRTNRFLKPARISPPTFRTGLRHFSQGNPPNPHRGLFASQSPCNLLKRSSTGGVGSTPCSFAKGWKVRIVTPRTPKSRMTGMAYGIIRITKHSSMSAIKGSGMHKDRERDTPNADPSRTPLNTTEGVGSSDELVKAVQARVDLATIMATGDDKPVLAVEYLITASPDFFKENSAEKVDRYFEDAKDWLKAKHGADNVVSITRHNDETSPHLSAFVVPLVEREAGTRKRSVIVGKAADGKPIRETREFAKPAEVSLSAKHYFGGSKHTLSELQTDFNNQVSGRYGLERGIVGSKAKHQSIKSWYTGIEKPIQPVTITPEYLKPKVVKKGFFRSTIETDEAVAERVTKAVQKAYAPAVEGAKQAALERRRASEMAKTASVLEKQVAHTKKALAPVLALAVLNKAKFVALVKGAATEVEQILQDRKAQAQVKAPSKAKDHGFGR